MHAAHREGGVEEERKRSPLLPCPPYYGLLMHVITTPGNHDVLTIEHNGY